MTKRLYVYGVLFTGLLVSGQLWGCAALRMGKGEIPADVRSSGDRIVDTARRFLGAPYRFGGETPQGFDCSGLVYYVHLEAGIRIPRTIREQLGGGNPVHLPDLQAGDLVFFRLSGRKVSHVGIYTGGGEFIHAPSRGKKVCIERLSHPYWQERLVAAGRFY